MWVPDIKHRGPGWAASWAISPTQGLLLVPHFPLSYTLPPVALSKATSAGSLALDSSPPALPQRQAFFLSEFWNLVSSFLSCPPGLGRLVWVAASLLVRPFRAPLTGRAGGGWDMGRGEV